MPFVMPSKNVDCNLPSLMHVVDEGMSVMNEWANAISPLMPPFVFNAAPLFRLCKKAQDAECGFVGHCGAGDGRGYIRKPGLPTSGSPSSVILAP
eukprot:scaffold590290_cov50-Prasinocladus_malaysianus.AAC.1